jgi:hypothetical protein
MNRSEFMELHDRSARARQTYFTEAEKTSSMLAGCTAEPLPFIERFRLMSQGLAENDAHLTYLGARNVLFEAARLGYGSSARI